MTVSATMSSDSRIGTPERERTDIVRANLDIADLWNSFPKIGIFSLNASHAWRPRSVLTHRRSPTTSSTNPAATKGK